MKLLKLIFIFQVMHFSFSVAQTYISPGNVHGTWLLNNSPFYVQGDITIPNDSSLIIEPGVIVEFLGHYALNVQGRLLAIGSESNQILFTAQDTTGFHNPDTTLGGWNGIEFIDTPSGNDTSKLIHCIIKFGKVIGSSPPFNSGGAIFIQNNNKVIISNCNITSNIAGGLDSPSGGGISLHFANIILIENIISNNYAWDGGGIKIWESSPYFFTNSIKSNIANEGGGGVWIGGLSNTEFNQDTISNNIAGINGGGIVCWQTTNTSLNDVVISDNIANWGGGIGVLNCELNVKNSKIIENSAFNIGGGISSDFSTVNIENTDFLSDTSSLLSGAVHGWYSEIQISKCNFESNESDFGGAIHCDFSQIDIDSCTFVSNFAIDGGAIHSFNTNLLVDSSFFSQNIAENNGGGIQFHVDTTEFASKYLLDISNTIFEENSSFYRGALDIRQFISEISLVNVTIDKSIFKNNTIDRGGNLLISGYIQDFTISNSKFQGNFASLRTSACQFSNNVTGKVYNSLFTSNYAQGGGAASAIGTGSTVDFINCTFTNNYGLAALTFRNDGNSTLLNNIFWGNQNYSIHMNAVTDSTPCNVNLNYCDIQYGLDSIIVVDSISVINWELGNLNDDPLFVDTLNNDFSLQNISPCLAAGIDSLLVDGNWYYAPLVDIQGNPRPNPSGTLPDMGAYESQFPNRIGDENLISPKAYNLFQNYPNPFNPSTTIEWQQPQFAFTTLKIYDVLGREFITLVNKEMVAGNHKTVFDASRLSSGIYFYQLKAGSFIQTKKMILIK